jgi:hypothetical protein
MSIAWRYVRDRNVGTLLGPEYFIGEMADRSLPEDFDFLGKRSPNVT